VTQKGTPTYQISLKFVNSFCERTDVQTCGQTLRPA